MCTNLITKNKKAFLLVEALITIVVLSTGLVLITRSFMMSLKAIDVIAQYEKARGLIEEKLCDLEIEGAIDSGISVEENFSEPYEEFTYTVETENIDEDNQDGTLNNVVVYVSWPSGQEKRQISVATFLREKD